MTTDRLVLLVIEDNPGDARLVTESLSGSGRFDLKYADRLDVGISCLASGGVDVVILDLGLPDSQGLDGLEKVLAGTPLVPVVVITGFGDDTLGLSAVAAGAQDFIVKGDFEPKSLVRTLTYAVERQSLLAELKLGRDELQAMNKVMRNFVAVAAHDLRTPLASIVGFATFLTENWATLSQEDRQKFVATIDRHARDLSRLVDDLLTLSTIEDGAVNRRPELIVLGEAIQRCLEAGGEASARVSVSCTPDLVVHVNPQHLGRILDNYLQNAFTYGQPPVRIEAIRVGDVVEVRVLDHGPGVPPEFVSSLFGKFARADTPNTRADKGTGLGLSIVRGLAEANGGQARYERNPSNGACFVVHLPAADGPGR
jgi:two-component system, sensor histidine kinase and response regulator